MFYLKSLIKEITGYGFFKSELFLCNKSNSLLKNNEVIIKDVDTTSLKGKKDYLFFQSNLENKTFYINSKNIQKNINSSTWIDSNFENTVLIYKYLNKCFEISIFNLDSSEINFIKKDLDLWDFYRDEDKFYFFNRTKNLLSSLSLITGEYIWQTNLEQFGKIINTIGLIENTLWVWLSQDRLIGIDVNNGQIINNYFPLQPIMKDIVGFVFHKHFIEKEQNLYFFHRSYLIQVNLKEQTTNLLWKNQDYNIGLSFFTDDFIYFIGGKNQGVFKNGIGVFCRKTNQVIWETTFELADYVVLKDIQFSDDKIYVLDTAGDLRIFEKEV